MGSGSSSLSSRTTDSGKPIDVAPVFGDITDTDLDVILNPCSLGGGTGQVGSAITRKWPDATRNIDVGGASKRFQLVKVPGGTGLKCKFIMHAACSESEDQILQVLNNCAASLKANRITSIAIPLIGSGTEGRDETTCAAELGLALSKTLLADKWGFMERIFIVTYDRTKHDVTKAAFNLAAGRSDNGMQKTAAGAGKGAVVPKPVDKGSSAYDDAVARLPPDLRALVDGVDTIGLADDVTADTASSSAAKPADASGGASKKTDGKPQNRVTMVQRDAQGQITGQIHFVNTVKK